MEEDKYYRVYVSTEITVKQIKIEVTNGGINPVQQDFKLDGKSVILAQSVNNSSKNGYLNITLKDGSNLMDVPVINLKVEEPTSIKKKRSRGCGGCAQRKRELEEIRKKELERQKDGTN